MTIIISIVVSAVAGFITGILVGRRNSNKVATAVNTVNTVASDIKKI